MTSMADVRDPRLNSRPPSPSSICCEFQAAFSHGRRGGSLTCTLEITSIPSFVCVCTYPDPRCSATATSRGRARPSCSYPSTATSDAVTTRTRPNVNADRDKDDEALHERLVEGIDIEQVEAVSD
jgi:hypothetical protein